jgi:protein involved in polysaccharide export with SLBB domain
MLLRFGRLRRRVAALLAVLAVVGPSAATAQTPPTINDILQRATVAPRTTAREGQPTQAESAPVAQTAVGEEVKAKPEPFGASIFKNATAPVSDAVNPDYLIQPGDRIALNILGGPGATDTTAAGAATAGPAALSTSLVVDPQGNIFVPEAGPVHVADVRAADLQSTVERQTGRVFTERVKVYAVLQTTHRVGVYVAGFVVHPGHYAGTASDSVLDYLVRAGGIDPSRGSYRNIKVLRAGAVVARADLYKFLITGQAPGGLLREGDTILVGEQGPMVEVDGAARNAYLFELSGPQPSGGEVMELARPLPSATHALLTGSRENKPFSEYLALNALATARVADQDKVTFVGDEPARTVSVRVEGSRIGPSFLVLPVDNRLASAMQQIAVDQALADTNDVYVLRRSVAEQQKRVIDEALDRLQRALYLAVSPTTGVSTIRANEAELVSTYILRARRATPDGRVVVTNDAGQVADFRLEEDDVIVIPHRSQMVMVAGEVLAPQAVLYRPEYNADDYIRQAGGYTERGRPGHLLVRRANGELIPGGKVRLRPGDELVILPYIDPKRFQLATDLMSLVYQVAVSAAALNNITN